MTLMALLGGWVSDKAVADSAVRRGRQSHAMLGMTVQALLLWAGSHAVHTIQLSFYCHSQQASAVLRRRAGGPLAIDMTPNYSGSLSRTDEYLRQYGRRARASPDGTDRNTDRLVASSGLCRNNKFSPPAHLAIRGCRLKPEKESSSVDGAREILAANVTGDSQSRSCDRLGCSPIEERRMTAMKRMTTVFREMLASPGSFTHQLLMTHLPQRSRSA